MNNNSKYQADLQQSPREHVHLIDSKGSKDINIEPILAKESKDEVQGIKGSVIKDSRLEKTSQNPSKPKETFFSLKSNALTKMRFKQKVQKIKEMSSLYRSKNLKDEDYELIGDLSYWNDDYVETNKTYAGQIYKGRNRSSNQQQLAIDPDGLLYSIFSIIFSLAGFIKFLLAPINFAFPHYCETDGCSLIKTINLLILGIFCLQIVSTFFTAFKEKNILIFNNRQIRAYYIQTYLIFDILPIIEILLNLDQSYPLLEFLYFFRIFGTFYYLEKFCIYFKLEQQFIALYHIIRLLLLIFSFAHYNALFFHYISQTGQNQHTWLQDQQLAGADWVTIYERLLYFFIITICTVGFGDVTPVTSRERIYMIIMTVFSCFLFGYAVNTVGSIFQQRDEQETILKQFNSKSESLFMSFFFIFFFLTSIFLNNRKKQLQISNYMQNRGVSKELCRKVLREIDYINKMERDGLFDDEINDILDKVSNELQQEVQTSISLKILRNCLLFNNILSIKCLNDYTKYMKEQTLSPGEILFQQGDQGNTIFFINRGELDIYLENSDRESQIILRRIQEKSYLGEMTFLSAEPRQTSARSVGVTHIIYFEYEDLRKILVNFPLDFEKVCMKRDIIQFDLNSTENKMRCFVCENLGHIMTCCPRITFKPDQELVWKKHVHLLRTRQKRDNDLIRKDRDKKFKTFRDRKEIRESLINFRQTLLLNFVDYQDFQKYEDNLNKIQTDDFEFYFNNPKIVFHNDQELAIDQTNDSFLEYCDALELPGLDQKRQFQQHIGSQQEIQDEQEQIVKVDSSENVDLKVVEEEKQFSSESSAVSSSRSIGSPNLEISEETPISEIHRFNEGIMKQAQQKPAAQLNQRNIAPSLEIIVQGQDFRDRRISAPGPREPLQCSIEQKMPILDRRVNGGNHLHGESFDSNKRKSIFIRQARTKKPSYPQGFQCNSPLPHKFPDKYASIPKFDSKKYISHNGITMTKEEPQNDENHEFQLDVMRDFKYYFIKDNFKNIQFNQNDNREKAKKSQQFSSKQLLKQSIGVSKAFILKSMPQFEKVDIFDK